MFLKDFDSVTNIGKSTLKKGGELTKKEGHIAATLLLWI